MILRQWMVLFSIFMIAVLLNTQPAAAFERPQHQDNIAPIADLAELSSNTNLLSFMLNSPKNSGLSQLSDAINFNEWQPSQAEALAAPRQHTTVWLTSTLTNSSERPIMRWLVIEPWRVNRVDSFLLNPDSGALLQQDASGLEVALEQRSVKNGKTIVPVIVNPGEYQQLYLKIYSDSLPFLNIQSWEPVSYTQSTYHSRTFQVALFSGIITLLVILLLQPNPSLIITGVWLFVAFVFEAEKDGFFSNYLLSALENYSVNLRVSSWIFTEQLFLTASLFLLGLNRHRSWQKLVMVSAVMAGIMASLTFVLDGASIRQLGILVTALYAGVWLFMIRPALRIKRKQQLILLSLLAVYWLVSVFLLVGYTFNFYYTSAFAVSRIYVEILVTLALIVTYSWQRKQHLNATELALKEHELRSKKILEQAIIARTADLHSALETAEKSNAAKVNFLGQISHDLRAPLTAILGSAQLQDAQILSLQKANSIIQDRAYYMKDLIDSLVDYTENTTLASAPLRDVYLMAFLDNLTNQAYLLAHQQDNHFQLKIDCELPTVIRCYPVKLQRILINLISNAAKYTQQGYISLSIATGVDKEGRTTLKFLVSDTGQGINSEQLANLYTPYFQSSKSNPGNGLGLAICFELTERLGGKLDISSELGVGTHINCTIPYFLGDEQQANLALPASPDLLPLFDAQGKTAWIIEDNPSFSELLDYELSHLGFETQLANSAEAFIEAAFATNAHKNVPAIVITDYQLPEASGLAVLKAVKSHWPQVPVLLLSATDPSQSPALGSSSLRFNGYLTKPIDLLALRLELAKLCSLEK